jgi:hypothetical protein
MDARVARGRFVGDCARLLGERLPALWETLFGKLDDALYNLADKSTNDLGYRVYFDAREIIGKQRRRLESDFSSRVLQEAGDVIARVREPEPRADAALGFENLALIAESDLEEILAMENLVSKAESRYRAELMEMDRRLAALMGRSERGSGENPFAPAALCKAFRDALAALPPFEPSVKLVVYKLFDRHVMDRLGDFYRCCLSDARYDPSVVATPIARRANAPTPTSLTDVASGIEGSAERSIDTLSIPFDVLRTLLARRRPCHVVACDAGRVTVPTAELLRLLSRLDVGSGPAKGAAGPETLLRARLSEALGSTAERPARALAERDEDTLDLVFLFFEQLLAGSAIPDPIKVLLGRMQIPVAKLALLDKGFFSDRAHPARALINEICRAALGWSEDDGRDSDGLYGMIERVIERLVLDFDGDPELFARLGRYFRAYVAREESFARAAVEAAGQGESAVDGGAAVASADRTHARAEPADASDALVAAAIDERLAAYAQVPSAVESLVREGWSRVLLDVHRAQGPESRDWQAALELIDRLLWSVCAKPTAEERRQLLSRIPRLFETLRRCLSEAGCDPRLAAGWLRELQTLHLDVLQGTAVGAVLGVESGGGSGDLVRDASRPRATAPGCRVGDWTEWTRDGAARARLKLVAWSPERDELMLVDRKGRSRTRMSARDFDAAMESGHASILGNGEKPMADEALRTLLTRLRQASCDA